MTSHAYQTSNHKLESDTYIYADAAARTGATGFVASDIGRIAYQQDTGEYYRLTATTPTWVQVVIGSLAVGTPASGNALVYNGSNWVASNVSAGQADSLIESFQNETGGTLSQLEAVYISGFDIPSDLPTVAKADASNASTMPAIGIVENDITTGNSGSVIISGLLSGVDTSSFSANDILYISATTPGQLTTTRPVGAADKVQELAEVIRSHATQGVIQVFGSGSVALLSNLPQNTAWVGDGSNVPTSTSVVLADGSIAGATGAAQDFGANGILVDTITDSGAGLITVNDSLDMPAGIDIFPRAHGQGLGNKFVDFGRTATNHFKTTHLLTGYSWISDGTFTVPATHQQAASDYMSVYHGSAARGFYAKSGTPSSDNHYLYARISAGKNIQGGLRFDDGTDTNYIEFLADGTANDGTYTMKMIASTGTVTSSVVSPTNKLTPIFLRYRLSNPSLCALLLPTGVGDTLSGLTASLSGWSSFRYGPVWRTAGSSAPFYMDWYEEAV